MNSFVVYEALSTGFKEGLKAGIVWLVLLAYLDINKRKSLIRPFYFGIAFVLFISFVSFILPQGFIVKDNLSKSIATSFAVLFISSLGALLHAAGMNPLHPFSKGETKSSPAVSPEDTANPLSHSGLPLSAIVFFFTVLFFSTDSIGSILFLRDLAVLKEKEFLIYASAVTGLFLSFSILFIIFKFIKPSGLGGFFDLPQLLLFLAMVKLLGGGIKGFAEISLIPSVQRGFMKFIHDFIHQSFVLLMVPDHPLLKTTIWNFIGIFFGPNVASAASLLILLFIPFVFIYYSLIKPLPESEPATGARQRKLKYFLLSDRRKKSLPIFFFICFILASWFSQGSEAVSRLYIPKPKPVVEDKGTIMIPINDPTMDVRDGALHKFSFNHDGQEIRIIIIKKPDNILSACLDACEICPPEGYGQRENLVVCIYCNTPIPVHTLGKPGGCNPIPLEVMIDDRFIRIELNELLKKWEYVKTGQGKEGVR